MKRIKRFGIAQTAIAFGTTFFFFGLVIMIPLALISTLVLSSTVNDPPMTAPPAFMYLTPFIYGVLAFVTTAIACFIYNIVASWIGGIEIEIADEKIQDDPDQAESNQQ